MIQIHKANETNTEVLALLGMVTYKESHGPFVDDKNDLLIYNETAFSVSKTKKGINNPDNLFYLVYKDDFPIGYAKLILNTTHDNVVDQSSCQIERLYILEDFIPLKVGQPLLEFIENKAKEFKLDTMWLSVHVKNTRAMRFYKKNGFREVANSSFQLNGKAYDNMIFLKQV